MEFNITDKNAKVKNLGHWLKLCPKALPGWRNDTLLVEQG
jgi:hypothetical protein